MKIRMNEVFEVLKAIEDLLIPISSRHKMRTFNNRKLLTKQEVINKLHMSEATYNRNLQKGLLVPMRLNGADLYFEEDILLALEESRRKGRI